MAEVLVNIGANTQDATTQINQLNQSLGKTGAAAEVATQKNEELEATLRKQEATIKTIDGAVNLLGGSVELLAGSLVLSGAATEEQAKEFEAAALGAIALADGAKRTFDGIKSLNEGLAATGGLTKSLQNGFKQLYAVVVANPFVALAAVLAAVAVAYESVRSEAEKNARMSKEELQVLQDINKVRAQSIDPLDRSLEVLTDSVEQRGLEVKAIEDLKKAYPGFEAFLTRENGLTKQGIEFLKAKIQIRKDEAALAAIAQKQVESEIELENKILEIRREEGFTQRAANQIAEARKIQKEETAALNAQETKYIESVNKAYEAVQRLQPTLDAQVKSSKNNKEAVKLETTEILTYIDAVNKRNKAIKEGIEGFIEGTGGIEKPVNTILRQLPTAQAELETTALSFSEYLQKINNDLNEFFESNTGKAVAASLNTAAQLASTLARTQDETTKEGFEKAKKYKIAEVVTSAIQASFQAFGAAQQFGPVLGPILGAAQVAAIAIASKKAISDIQSSTFGGGTPSISTPSTGGGTAVLPTSPSFNPGGFLGQPQGTLTPITTPAPTLRAYVVSADVTNGQQAQAQIARRRTLGPG